MPRSESSQNAKPRRRSWLHNSGFFSLFTSAPPSPIREHTSPKPRSQSLEATPSFKPSGTKSPLAAIFSKARRSQLKRSPTAGDISVRSSKIPVEQPTSTFYSDSTMQSYLSMHPLQREEREENEEQLLHLFEVDEEEVERIQLKNDLVKLAFEGEFPPPVDLHQLRNGRILDVGCGPGFWCIDLAQKYPSIKVIGVDCENVFPEPITMPYNCQLKRFNVLNGLGQKFEENSFDGIHIRFMALSFTAEQYARVIKDCWQLLKPGGFMEILESDVMVCSPGPTTAKLNHEMAEMASSRGIRPWLARHIAELIPEDAENKQEKYRSLPIGWGGRLGVLFRDDMLQLLTKFQPAVRRYYGRTESSQQMFEAELAVASREMEQYRSYSNFHHFTFQKPVINTKRNASY